MPGQLELLERDEWVKRIRKSNDKALPLRKGFFSEVKQVGDEEDRTLDFVISDGEEDRDGDTIAVDGWDFNNYRKNPVVLFVHDYSQPSVAIGDPRIEDGVVKSRTKFASPDEYAFADTLYKLYKGGYMRATSVGFLPKRWEERRDAWAYDFKEQELLEYSLVPVPSNPRAVLEAGQKGIDIQPLINWADEVYKATGRDPLLMRKSRGTREKSVVPFQDWPLANKDRVWDGDAAVMRLRRWASDDGSGDKDTIDWPKYRKGFVWYDSEDPENFGSYKLPIVDVINGEPHAVWRGVVAAMAALLGARGGVDIPDNERRGVYNHLARYYKKFGEDPPEFEAVDSVLSLMYQNIAETIALSLGHDIVFETVARGKLKWPVPEWATKHLQEVIIQRAAQQRQLQDITAKQVARLFNTLKTIDDKLTPKPEDIAAIVEESVVELLSK